MSNTSSAPLGGHPRRGETVRVKGGLYAGRIGTVVQVQGEGRWRDSGYRVVEFVGQDGKPFVEEFAPDYLERVDTGGDE